MQNENHKNRFAAKGYYIALIVCIAAVGISGYVFVRTAQSAASSAPEAVETMETVESMETVEAVSPVPTVTPAPAQPSAKATAPGGKTGGSKATPSEAPKTADAAARATDLMEDAYEPTMGEVSLEESVLWPLQGDVIATFSQDTLTYSRTMADWRTHEGMDIAGDYGSLVSATQNGTVTAVYQDDFLGNVVVVSHSGDLATLYANLADGVSVSVGDKVLAGETLGQIGESALLETADPPHLHFEVFAGGSPMDPLLYLPE